MSNSELAITYLLQSSYVMTALIVCVSAYFTLRYVKAKNTVSRFAVRGLWALCAFAISGAFWLNTGTDLNERIYKMVLCPAFTDSLKCRERDTTNSAPRTSHEKQAVKRYPRERTKLQQSDEVNSINNIIRGQ